MEQQRPTQSDVARAAGVHRATVSLTFKNHPSIPDVTKQRVRECAARLGYSPDPMLSALAAYRSRLRPKAFQGALAWLANDVDGLSWRQVAAYRDYYGGAAARARTHGFSLDIFDLPTAAPSPERLAAVFRARNIHGILLPPQMAPDVEIAFPWQDFSAVTFGSSLIKPRLHAVASAQFRSTVLTMRQLKRLGYQRIGLFFASGHDEKTDHNYLAGYLVEQFATPQTDTIPPLFTQGVDPPRFRQWYAKYRPQAIVTGYREILALLDALKIRVPRDLGVASPLLERDMLGSKRQLSGIYEDSVHIGEVAMDLLSAMIQRGERGVPRLPQRLLVEGVWTPGATLRQAAETVHDRPPGLKRAPHSHV